MTENTIHHLKAFVYFVLFIAILGGVILYFVLPFTIIQPQRIDHPHTPENYKLNFSDIRIINEPQDTLAGYWTYAENKKPKAVVLLLHGIGGCKEELLHKARHLSKLGYDAVLMDSRGHGKFENGFCTYGFYEKADFKLVIDEIKKQQPNLKLGVWGHSLGGALSLQIMENDQRIAFGIIESSFTHLRQIIYDYQQRIFKGISLKPFADFVLYRASKIAKFDPDVVLPIEAAKRLKQPILLIHGVSDEHISVEYSKTLFENVNNNNKELYLIPGAAHMDLWEKGGKEYEQKVFGFILKQVQ